MQCNRCHGEMAYDLFHDMKDDTGKFHFFGWRCVICGDVLDPVIVANRTKQQALLQQEVVATHTR